MNRIYRFLYHLLKFIPFKSKKMRNFLQVLRFYYKGNDLIVLSNDGRKIKNPIKIPKCLQIQTYLNTHNNKIVIAENQKTGSCIKLNFYNANSINIEIGENNMLCMTVTIQGKNGHAVIGNNNYICQSTVYLYCSGKTTFNIGNNNLFSDGIVLWAGEGHCVINPVDKSVTNMGGNITIGNNNWVCQNVCFLKRAKIGNGCIVGYGAVVGTDFSKNDNCVIAGNPAVVTKSNVQWSNQAPWEYNGKIYME